MSGHNPIPADAPDLLSAEQLSKWLNVGVMSIHRWYKVGKFPPPTRIGVRHLRWHKREVIEYLALARRLGGLTSPTVQVEPAIAGDLVEPVQTVKRDGPERAEEVTDLVCSR